MPDQSPSASSRSEIPTPQDVLRRAQEKPEIELPGDNRLISQYCIELAGILRSKDVFYRNGEVVWINLDGKLTRLGPDELRTFVEQYCVGVEKSYGNREMRLIETTMSLDTARAVVVSPQFLQGLRTLKKVNPCRQPILRADGTIELLPEGFDEQGQILTLSHGVSFDENLPLDAAVSTINDVLGEFCFIGGPSTKAVVVSAIMGLFSSGLLPARSLRPCFICLANGEGAGKSLTVKFCVHPILGSVPVGVKPDREEEMEKVLVTAVREASLVLFLDNLKGHLDSPRLEAFISSEEWRGRLLGRNETYTGENLATIFITGNGLTVSPDIRRRALFIQLSLPVERAEDRVFQRVLDDAALQQLRPRLLAALWALVRHWDSQGRPDASRPHPGFPAWAKIIGGIVEIAGFGCCLATPDLMHSVDTEADDMCELVNKMAEANRRYSFSELIHLAASLQCFESILQGLAEFENQLDISPPRWRREERAAVGLLFRRYNGRLIGDHQFTITGRGHARRFSVTRVVPTPA